MSNIEQYSSNDIAFSDSKSVQVTVKVGAPMSRRTHNSYVLNIPEPLGQRPITK